MVAQSGGRSCPVAPKVFWEADAMMFLFVIQIRVTNAEPIFRLPKSL